MALQLKDILQKDVLSTLNSQSVIAIERAINECIDNKFDAMEKDNSRKFDTLVESLSDKFEKQVSSVIVENVKDSTTTMINKKFYDIVKDMVNLLENAGISTTETTKKLQRELKETGSKLQKAYDEHNAVKEMYDDNNKLVIILNQTKGMKPEIIDAAIEFFKNKDAREIDKDAIASFLDGDHSALFDDNSNDITSGELDLDKVKDAIDEINEQVTSKAPKNAVMESLGKGLKQQKASFSPNISIEMLQEAADGVQSEGELDHTKEALSKIEEYRDLGFNFK